jgi:hypothetical protein
MEVVMIFRLASVNAIFSIFLLSLCGGRVHAQVGCPNPPVPSITSSQVPGDVCVPNGFGGNPIQFFDDYSWRAFIALVWPAANGQRGQPDSSTTVAGAGPRVFETYKAIWEIFHNDGSAPGAWNNYDAKQFNACNVDVSFGDLVFASFSKFSDLGQAGVGTLVGPLIAQNQTYVRYLTGFNEIEFNQIVMGNLYLRKNLPMTGPFQNSALDVKSAWILMNGIAHPERYYTRNAIVLDPQSGQCSTQLVGLVGLHIVQKTPTRPQWIWSTFEQVDNVPPPVSGAPGTFGFNDGKGGVMPPANPYPIDPLILPTPPPFNVQRLVPINPSTANTNDAYRALLKQTGSVWQFYRLVMTQWPTVASDPSKPGTPAFTFPGTNATSAFANVTMETFDQVDQNGQPDVKRGCMNCHNFTRAPTDFLWSLADHAFPPNVPDFIFRDESFRNLQELFKTMAPENKLTAASGLRSVRPAPNKKK